MPTPTNNKIIFVLHQEHNDHDVRRAVRARAAEYSHQRGDRKPKERKKTLDNNNIRKRKATKKISLCTDESISGVQSRESSVASVATTPATSVDITPHQAQTVRTTLSRLPSPYTTSIATHKTDPFRRYPVQPQPWFDRLLDYMGTFMLRGWRALDTTAEERTAALVWVQNLTMSNPCYFYMNMLSVSGDLASRGVLDTQMVAWHSSQVVKSINEALSSPEPGGIAIGTILAVGRIAFHEIMLGDMMAGNRFHRPAWARMLVMAGGLDALALPSLVRLHLGWANRLMTLKTGIQIWDLESSLRTEPTFNVSREVRSDITVLDQYVPMRNKLKAYYGTLGDAQSIPHRATADESTTPNAL